MRATILGFVLGGVCYGQLSATVGPSPAPVNGYIAVSIANDTTTTYQLPTPCEFQVRDSNNVVVYDPGCPPIIVTLFPGAVHTVGWLTTGFAAGTYFVDVFLPNGTISTIPATLDPAIQAGLVERGPLRIGTTRGIFMDSPGDGGFDYLMAASGPPVSGGIPTCAGLVPLEMDSLLLLSLGPNQYFSGFNGTVNPTGQVWTAWVTVPNDPTLIGIQFYLCAVVRDWTAPCVVRTIAAAHLVQIV
jgi:hypothetical protein